MSILPKDTIKVVGQTIGLTDISNDVASALASDTEYRVREIIQEALKFMKHAKRDKLTTTDINAALRLRNVEQLYGYSGHDAVRFERAVGAKGLFFIHDEDVKLADVVAAPLPKVPREVTMTAHWLAIEGVQPAIPQNPIAAESDSSAKDATSSTTTAPADSGGAATSIESRPLVKHTLSQELQAYYNNIVGAVRAFVAPPGASDATRSTWRKAVGALRHDGGVQQLLPYFTQFVGDEVASSLRQLDVLRALLELADALLHNPNLDVEPYLHQLMPPLLTCMVGKRLCANKDDDHWSLRDKASLIVADICDRYGNSYPDLQSRVTKTLLMALLDAKKPMTTHYGAIRGLTELGPHVIGLLLMPHVVGYVDLLRPHLDAEPPTRATREAQRCFDALRAAACKHVAHAKLFPVSDAALQQTLNGRSVATGGAASSSAAATKKKKADKGGMDVDDDANDKDDNALDATPSLHVSFDTLYSIFGEALNAAQPVDADVLV